MALAAALGWTLPGFALSMTGCDLFAPPPDRSGTYAPCCDGLATCVPSAVVPLELQQMVARDSCGELLSCVPTDLLGARGAPRSTCTSSVLAAEGRCLPACIPMVADRASALAADGCDPGMLCVPCFDPVDGESTGACNLGNDPGPEQPAHLLTDCCGGLGRCAPATLVPDEYDQLLGQDVCQPRELCVAPEQALADPQGLRVPDCVDEALAAEGRCIPSCLPLVSRRSDQLARYGCSAGSLCVPCFDPLSGEATGACSLGADPGPREAPKRAGSCCGGEGRCLPRAKLRADQSAYLAPLDCTGAVDQLCVAPRGLAETPDSYLPPTCVDDVLRAEGRCLPACLPKVAARASSLRRATCEAASLCVPCFDPVSSEASGACSLPGDPGPQQPARTLAACCDGQGLCTPRSLVPQSTLNQFDRGTCTDNEDVLCVAPVAALAAPDTFRPPGCLDPVLQTEGRCLPECLPQVAAQQDRLRRADCAEGNRCVPCFDPITSMPTGACSSNGDAPAAPPHLLPGCCKDGDEERGVCVPAALLPAGSPELPQDTCDQGTSCVPRDLASDPNASLDVCRDLTNQEGRCLLNCLLEPFQFLFLARGSCGLEQSCVPCMFAGRSTGVCAL